jgi:putative ABC transport system substrate-binding protein
VRTTLAEWLLIFLTLATVHLAEAQQPKKVPHIGFLVLGFPRSSTATLSPVTEAFYQGLRDVGFTVGKNVLIEYRYAEGKIDRLPRLAAELVSSKVDLIVAPRTPAIHAARQATSRIPIVILSVGDPITAEFVTSLAQPGTNITGVSSLRPELSGKLLQLLTEAISGVARIGVLWSPKTSRVPLKEAETAARGLRVQLKILEVRNRDDLEKAFMSMTKDPLGGLLIQPAILFARNEKRIADFAIKSRLPAIFWRSEFAEKGGLMAYGPTGPEQFRRAGVLAGKILTGSRPEDLPMEQSMKFELVINLKTAKQIGVTVSPDVLYRADNVIK